MWGSCLARVRTCPCTRLSANTRPWARTGPGRAPCACVGDAGSHLGRRRRARCSQRVGACTRYRSPHERMWVGCVQIKVGRGDIAVNCRLDTHSKTRSPKCMIQPPYPFVRGGQHPRTRVSTRMDATCSLDCNPRASSHSAPPGHVQPSPGDPHMRAIVSIGTPCSLHSGACTLALGLACMHALTVRLRANKVSATLSLKTIMICRELPWR